MRGLSSNRDPGFAKTILLLHTESPDVNGIR